ncbi:MAG: A24 family peptidase [Thermogutta sp.]|nr:A24 family peptidase [Thermogutta sp.]HOP76640.1 A24 family peptidase [Thermogutta sp.]HPU07378.1 A24 family peptidase [Thermogutta sp.]HQF13475.1 A24 family peptidase [Thermogutta sp.]
MLGILLILLAVASMTDVLWGRIPNKITYPGIISGLLLNVLGTLAVRLGWARAEHLSALGWIGMGQSVLGFLACGLVMLACYVFFRIGGGDVKLIAMLGTFLGPDRGITAMLWTFVLGACLGLIALVWRVGPWRLLVLAGRHLLWSIRLGRWDPLTPEERAQLQPPLFLAPSALAATVIVGFELVERYVLAVGP